MKTVVSLAMCVQGGGRINEVHFSGKNLNSSSFKNSHGQMHTCRVAMSPVLRTVQYRTVCWRGRCVTNAVEESVEHDAVPTLRKKEKKASPAKVR